MSENKKKQSSNYSLSRQRQSDPSSQLKLGRNKLLQHNSYEAKFGKQKSCHGILRVNNKQDTRIPIKNQIINHQKSKDKQKDYNQTQYCGQKENSDIFSRADNINQPIKSIQFRKQRTSTVDYSNKQNIQNNTLLCQVNNTVIHNRGQHWKNKKNQKIFRAQKQKYIQQRQLCYFKPKLF